MMEKRLFNIDELSQYLGMPKASIYTYVHLKRIPEKAVVRIGRALKFEKDEIDQWIDDQSPPLKKCA